MGCAQLGKTCKGKSFDLIDTFFFGVWLLRKFGDK